MSLLPFDYFFVVLSFTFFGILTLYALRTYLYFKESSLAHHLKIISGGLALFTVAKLVSMGEALELLDYPYADNILEMLGALAILFGIIDFRKEFLRFKWLKEIEAQIAAERQFFEDSEGRKTARKGR